MTRWLPEFTRQTWTFDDYTRRFGYSCAYAGGEPVEIEGERGLLHSTEGSSWPGYQSGRTNPNFTLDPWRKQRRQHVPADIAARATMANNNKFVQIEIVGFCNLADARKYGMEEFYLERMGADELAYIAESLAIIGDANGIPTTSSVRWEEYPRSGWAQNGVRLSQAALDGYSGWLGHQHAPKPDIHGDPGQWPHTMNLMAAMRGNHPHPAPPSPTGKLTVDGYLGTDTLNRWGAVMGTHTGKSDLVRAVQRFLNAKGARDENGHKLVIDGLGLYNNTAHETARSHTQYALQRYLRMPVKDGKLSHPSDCIKEVQRRLNKAKTGSKEF